MSGFRPTCPKCSRLCPARAQKCSVCGTRLFLGYQREQAKRQTKRYRIATREQIKLPGARLRDIADSAGAWHDEPSAVVPEHIAELPRDVIRDLLERAEWSSEGQARR